METRKIGFVSNPFIKWPETSRRTLSFPCRAIKVGGSRRICARANNATHVDAQHQLASQKKQPNKHKHLQAGQTGSPLWKRKKIPERFFWDAQPFWVWSSSITDCKQSNKHWINKRKKRKQSTATHCRNNKTQQIRTITRLKQFYDCAPPPLRPIWQIPNWL